MMFNWCWSWTSNTLATWYELTHWKRPWCWERLKTGGEGNNRRWDGWMESLTQWTWVWATSGRRWRTDKLGVLQSMSHSETWLSDWTTTNQIHRFPGRLNEILNINWGFPDSSVGKGPPAKQETPVRSLGREDPLEKGKATHTSILGCPLWVSS